MGKEGFVCENSVSCEAFFATLVVGDSVGTRGFGIIINARNGCADDIKSLVRGITKALSEKIARYVKSVLSDLCLQCLIALLSKNLFSSLAVLG